MKTKTQNNFKSILTTFLSALLMIATVFTAINCDDEDSIPAEQNVLQIAVANADFDILEAAALKAGSGVTNVLSGTTPITVFAPTDAAFISYLGAASEAAAITAVNGLSSSSAADLLTFHVIAGSEIKAADIATGTTAVTTARGANNKAFVTKVVQALR